MKNNRRIHLRVGHGIFWLIGMILVKIFHLDQPEEMEGGKKHVI